MADSETLRTAIFDVSQAIHSCRNNATYLPGEKIQLGLVFDKLTTRALLIRLNAARVNATPEEDRKAAHDQVTKALNLLRTAERKSERREAIGETFEILELIDRLLPEEVHRFLG